jgi:hypothetical protein
MMELLEPYHKANNSFLIRLSVSRCGALSAGHVERLLHRFLDPVFTQFCNERELNAAGLGYPWEVVRLPMSSIGTIAVLEVCRPQ